MPEPEKIVTVLMSGELVEQLEEWSPPVQLKIVKTPGIGTGYEAIARPATIAGVPVVEFPPGAFRAERIVGYRVRLFHSDSSPNWQVFRPEDVEIIRTEAIVDT